MRKKVLIVRFSALGDLVLTTGPLAQLRKQNPALTIDLLTSEIGQELFVNSVDVDRTILVEKGSGIGHLIKLYRKLDSYDVVIDLQGNFKSYFLRLFLKSRFVRIEKQSKERRAFVKSRSHQTELTEHVVSKYYKTMQKGFPELADKSVEELRPFFPPHPFVYDANAFDFKNSIVVHPYASQKNKEWPYFVKFIEQLLKEGTAVVVVGQSETSIPLPNSPMILNLTNRTTLHEMLSIIDNSKALVTTDSGPMHLGLSVKAPTLAIFGPTTRELGFYPSFENSKVVEEDLDCRPCHVHGGDVCPLGHHQCMKNISPEKVKSALEQLLQ